MLSLVLSLIIRRSIAVMAGVALFSGSLGRVEAKSPSIQTENSDVTLFYRVIDAAQKAGTAITGQYMYENYVLKSSPGLKDGYVVIRRDIFPENNAGEIDFSVYNQKIQELLPFFMANRKYIQNQDLLSPAVLQDLSERMCAVLREELCRQLLTEKKIYYTISGALNMGGTAFPRGVFIDVSMIRHEDIDYGPLPERLRGVSARFFTAEDQKFLIAHEFFHTFQVLLDKNFYETLRSAPPSPDTVILLEGGAQYFTLRILDRSDYPETYKRQKRYMAQHPERYREFGRDILAVNATDDMNEKRKIMQKWFFNAFSEAVRQGLYPQDLGYYIAPKIIKTYYDEERKHRKETDVILSILKRDIPIGRLLELLDTLSSEAAITFKEE